MLNHVSGAKAGVAGVYNVHSYSAEKMAALGLRLRHRTTGQIEPTEAGQLYFERCKRIVAEPRLAHEQLGEMVAQPSVSTRFVFTGG